MSDIKSRIIEFLKSNGRLYKSTAEIAKHLGVSTSTVRYHLMRMSLDGIVEFRKSSDRVFLWRLKEEQ